MDYYKRQYGKTIVDHHQPMLVSRPRVKAEAEKAVGKEVRGLAAVSQEDFLSSSLIPISLLRCGWCPSCAT